jgi:asparagine synthase (glutamine-hydrolysing)
MCGIAGILRRDGAPMDVHTLARLTASLAHRGPDDVGFLGGFDDGTLRTARSAEVAQGSRVALGHQRLSIIELGPGGWQPMVSQDGSLALVFNGEIYNYRELRRELEAEGHRFRAQSDTEVLLASLERWGLGALSRLVGMFAFAAVDARARRLVLARDPFGIKPLYYAEGPHGLLFASELRGLLAARGGSRRIHPRRLYDYLRFGLTDDGEETLFAGVRQVAGGHALSFSLDQADPPTLHRYLGLGGSSESSRDPFSVRSFEEAAEQLRSLFLESIRLHLRSDVPVGAALSGGIDSSSIVCAMRAAAEQPLELHAFSYVADDPALSEERWIDLAGGAARAQIHKVRLTPQELVSDLDELLRVQEQPFGSTSIYAQYRVFRLAKEQGIRVLLDGQGADEMLGGYRTYLASRLVALLRKRQFRRAARFFARIARSMPAERADLVARAAGLCLPAPLQRVLRPLVGQELEPAWLSREWFRARDVHPAPLWQSRSRDALREHLQVTLLRTSLPMLLRYEDRNSMAFSIESRVPFLHPELVRFVLALPEEWILGEDGTSKQVFRRAMRGLVPDAVLDRRDKIGFATPERRWLEAVAPWVEKVLSGEAMARVPVLRPAALRESWQEVLRTGRGFDFRVWRWINLVRWAELFEVSFEG